MILLGQNIVQRVLVRIVLYLVVQVNELLQRQGRRLIGILMAKVFISQLQRALNFVQ